MKNPDAAHIIALATISVSTLHAVNALQDAVAMLESIDMMTTARMLERYIGNISAIGKTATETTASFIDDK